ncbi:hypothetical protein [Nocardia jejuensis]|uniref:hypothetical protein n=1 Tax=Nocardia jejuensis TaxID=328049 RepID=UPI000AF7308D|nr:hypothetical protein [Nocardia jejuensis]
MKIDLSPLAAGAEVPPLLATPATPGAPTDMVPVAHGVKNLLRTGVPATVVLGSGGGVGVTTTVLGVAAAIGTHPDTDREAVAVDATAWGGDLARRGADSAVTVSTLQAWLGTPQPGLPSAVAACTGRSSTGVRILARASEPLPQGHSFVSVARLLEESGSVAVYDGGGHVANRLIAPLIEDPRLGLALVVSASPASLNSLNHSLSWLLNQYGEWLINRVVVVVNHQFPGGSAAAVAHVRTHLARWVRAVVEIPYDRALAAGGPLIWERFERATRTAYRLAMGELQ